MSGDIVTVAEDTAVAVVASIFESRRIRRIPVVREGKLIGIVTRADLVRALATKTLDRGAGVTQNDEAIRIRLRSELERQPWWQSKWSTVFVTDGVVRYMGVSESEVDRQAARVAAENVPGVRDVQDDRLQFADWQPMV